jgi:site-specific DNA-methyltransferase (adenine-specific)
MQKIICGDSLKVLWTLPHARMIFADPPDNLGLQYEGYEDHLDGFEYEKWLRGLVWLLLSSRTPIFWISHYYRYLPILFDEANLSTAYEARLILWRFTFGQHQQRDCGNGFRPIMRLSLPDVRWNTDAIRIPSARMKNGDKRADRRGRGPDDVWEFPRICGNYTERRPWAVTQHPEALVERAVKMSCRPGDLVIDLFAHSGTVNRVCRRLGLDCLGVDLSPTYCRRIAIETGAEYMESEANEPVAALPL